MSIIPNWKIAAVSLVAGIVLGWYVQGLRWDADAAELSSQQSDNISKGQQAIIAGQALEFQRFNEIARQANQYSINIKVNSNEKQLVYRTIIKRDPVSRQCVPGDVAERLLDYADSLRSSAMPTVASACKLTYAQAVYWIDPLLTAIDKANRQLAGIRETESNRGSQ
ncbi:hypothetical protein KSL88_11775 [Pectobacterium polaris]|uniref:hypothetical protein n=1 Tax=Pectobacterium polaris TaxID=2042057 RepID=UPI001CC3F86D|nr:hypothetical protein [Pectobacterium polaris]UAY90232.1 hypothetical protein KSL88_11775 [Pectobacterium polaris]